MKKIGLLLLACAFGLGASFETRNPGDWNEHIGKMLLHSPLKQAVDYVLVEEGEKKLTLVYHTTILDAQDRQFRAEIKTEFTPGWFSVIRKSEIFIYPSGTYVDHREIRRALKYTFLSANKYLSPQKNGELFPLIEGWDKFSWAIRAFNKDGLQERRTAKAGPLGSWKQLRQTFQNMIETYNSGGNGKLTAMLNVAFADQLSSAGLYSPQVIKSCDKELGFPRNAIEAMSLLK